MEDTQADQAEVLETQEETQDESQVEELDTSEPPVRKTKQDNREAYYRRKAEKAAKEADEYRQQLEVKNDVDPETQGLDDIIEAKIEEKVGSRLEAIDRQQRRGEEAEFIEIASTPVKELYKKHKDKIRKYWDHESRRNLPFTSVLYEIIGPELVKEGAKYAKEADSEAAPVVGSTARQTGGEVDFKKMSSKEFSEWEKKHGITGRDNLNRRQTL